MNRLKVIQEFSRCAPYYNEYNSIQKQVAETLVSSLREPFYESIIDLGCGSGAVFSSIQKKSIVSNTYVAIDSSKEMLALHPSKKVQKICMNFDEISAYKDIKVPKKGRILLSSSALQWTADIEALFATLSCVADEAHFAIFTDNTFKTLHENAKIQSPIYSAQIIRDTIQKYYHAIFELKEYKLYFDNTREMFHYIKKSGVSGAEKKLSYTAMKKLMIHYPLEYLEFEVIFIKAKSKRYPPEEKYL